MPLKGILSTCLPAWFKNPSACLPAWFIKLLANLEGVTGEAPLNTEAKSSAPLPVPCRNCVTGLPAPPKVSRESNTFMPLKGTTLSFACTIRSDGADLTALPAFLVALLVAFLAPFFIAVSTAVDALAPNFLFTAVRNPCVCFCMSAGSL